MLISPALGHLKAGNDFVFAEWSAEVDPQWIAPLHHHFECDEGWYVLEGQLEFLVDGETFVANAGDMVWVASGKTHTYRNPGPAFCRYLLVMTPETNDLINAIHALEVKSKEKIEDAFAQHKAEFLGFP